MKFEKNYTEYWEKTVNQSVDGTFIAGSEEAKHYLEHLGLKKMDSILDLGCSTGRMYDLLSMYSDKVYGLEPDSYAADKARNYPYIEVKQGKAEATKYDSELFDFIFCWAVFDIVDHFEGLQEQNRILKQGGRFLITGKGDNYDSKDSLAFNAEKNAYLKKFPNKFTNLKNFCSKIREFGFEIIDFFSFDCRGDFGKLKYKHRQFEINNLGPAKEIEGYEYLMIVEKLTTPKIEGKKETHMLDAPFSRTAKKMAEKAGMSVESYFISIGID